jgi:hypothetical protein
VNLFGERSSGDLAPPRFYIYVSDAKVDMLLAQIPKGRLAGVAAELTIDLKLLRLTVSSREAPETRFSRVAVVSRYLDDAGVVGPTDGGRMYLAEEAVPMRWGLVGRDKVQSIAFFAGESGDTRVFLTGSPHHVVGVGPLAPVGRGQPGSYQPPLNVYYDVFEDWDEPQELSAAEYDYADQFEAEMGLDLGSIAPGRPVERLSFVARRIHGGRDRNGRRAVFGSPIWVAIA